jgi:hypothetical protein
MGNMKQWLEQVGAKVPLGKEKRMKRTFSRWYLVALLIFLMLSLFSGTSCIGTQGRVSVFYDAGPGNLTMTGAQFSQYLLYRFDTDSSQRTLTTPSAADIVSRFSSPVVGEVSIFAVVADGNHTVTVSGGTNVTVKPSASTVAAESTLTIFCKLDNVSKGSEAVTLY